ncbi:hypothetical protein LTR37_016456 [Vermiconidia calcicola]|uniref:Uncharacterized protein n=1 Tax=Vermiconidia calcicola TaxID=1690605 RepID=A0ACC3MN14_9PEZI|nr:hypothetical protein LTR37_016456 [Vermiconidia calcicola]
MPPDYSTQNDMEGAELVSRDFTGRERVKSCIVPFDTQLDMMSNETSAEDPDCAALRASIAHRPT